MTRQQIQILRWPINSAARAIAFACMLVVVSALPWNAPAGACDPDNTAGDCFDGDSCNNNDACSSSTCDPVPSTCCSPSDNSIPCGGNCSSLCADASACNDSFDCTNYCDPNFLTCCSPSD